MSTVHAVYYIFFFLFLFFLKKNFKNFQKKKSFKKFVVFSNIFPPSLLNIGLYTYIVRYKSSIKIPGFFEIFFFKKNFKKKKNI